MALAVWCERWVKQELRGIRIVSLACLLQVLYSDGVRSPILKPVLQNDHLGADL